MAMMSGMWRGLCLMLAMEAIIVALVMAGRRKTALAALVPAVAVPWLIMSWSPGLWEGVIPGAWTAVTVYSLEAVALIASPGPRYGRRLMHWGHWAVLMAVMAAVEAYEFMPFRGLGSLAAMVFLIFAASRLGRTLRLSRYYLLLLAATFYPTVFEVAGYYLAGPRFMIGADVPSQLVLTFAGPLLCAAVAVGTVIWPRRRRII
jgi:hypothetical protein